MSFFAVFMGTANEYTNEYTNAHTKITRNFNYYVI